MDSGLLPASEEAPVLRQGPGLRASQGALVAVDLDPRTLLGLLQGRAVAPASLYNELATPTRSQWAGKLKDRLVAG